MEATQTKVIEYFSSYKKQYVVPLFQRPYTWSESQWKTLWNDTINFYGRYNDQHSTHFTGAVVTMPERSTPVGVSKFSISDGQQRLTTITLLLCAIRDSLSPGDEAQKQQIQDYYLTNYGFDGEDVLKLLPTETDRAAYSNLICGTRPSIPESQFNKAYRYFCRRLQDKDSDENPIDPKLILEIVERRLMVVMINLADSDDPYLIFESLNFKGAPLEQADLVRNFFLMRFPVEKQKAIYRDSWLPMQNRLGSRLTDFMRHFLAPRAPRFGKPTYMPASDGM